MSPKNETNEQYRLFNLTVDLNLALKPNGKRSDVGRTSKTLPVDFGKSTEVRGSKNVGEGGQDKACGDN